MLDVCLPGTGGMVPLPDRWLSCCWVEHQGKGLLVDCGEGTQIALKEAGCKLSRLELLLVTHFHADHIAGLPGLLLTLGNHGKSEPLLIAGPQGLRAVVSALTVVASALPYRLELLELKAEEEGGFEHGELSVSYLPLNHGVRCLGYRISLRRKPVFNPEKASRLGVPKQLYGALHSGRPVQLPDGRRIEPEMVIDGHRPPLSVCYITDSLPTDEMAAFARGADLLICEGMHGDESMRGKMAEKGHMLYRDSAAIAAKAGVRELWLTHFSPAVKDPELYLDEARAIFPRTCAGYDGKKATLK